MRCRNAAEHFGWQCRVGGMVQRRHVGCSSRTARLIRAGYRPSSLAPSSFAPDYHLAVPASARTIKQTSAQTVRQVSLAVAHVCSIDSGDRLGRPTETRRRRTRPRETVAVESGRLRPGGARAVRGQMRNSRISGENWKHLGRRIEMAPMGEASHRYMPALRPGFGVVTGMPIAFRITGAGTD